MLTVRLITEVRELRELRAAWLELLENVAAPEFALHPDWALSWLGVFGDDDGRALRTLAIYDGAALVGLAPLLVRTFKHRGIPFQRLELIGAGENQKDETCGDYLGVLARAGQEAEVAKRLATALVDGDLGRWHELFLDSTSGDNPITAQLADEMLWRGMGVEISQWDVAPYATLPKTWDAYLASLKQSKRGQIRKAMREFEAWAGGPPVMHRVRTSAELPEAKRILTSLHGERWTEGGVFASPKFTAFHDAIMAKLLELNALDLGWLSVKEEPVAAFYNFRLNGKSCFYQGGRKTDLPDNVRVGVAMHAYLIRAAIEEGLREYDFLAGASQYKLMFASAQRPLIRLRVARPTIRETARRAVVKAIAVAKRFRR